jgi:hypothetical protein
VPLFSGVRGIGILGSSDARGWTGFGEKKLWDWLQLLSALAIPIVLAFAGYWFTSQQDARQREIEEQRADDAALQAYLDQMSTLLLDKDLRDSAEDSEARTLARARTLTVLGRLDARRRTQVLRFLSEANLIRSVNGKHPVLLLNDANLSGANLPIGADLSDTNLSSADLSGAYLAFAYLNGAKGLTKGQLERAKSLVGTTMPDGQKYEEWLKDKEG